MVDWIYKWYPRLEGDRDTDLCMYTVPFFEVPASQVDLDHPSLKCNLDAFFDCCPSAADEYTVAFFLHSEGDRSFGTLKPALSSEIPFRIQSVTRSTICSGTKSEILNNVLTTPMPDLAGLRKKILSDPLLFK